MGGLDVREAAGVEGAIMSDRVEDGESMRGTRSEGEAKRREKKLPRGGEEVAMGVGAKPWMVATKVGAGVPGLGFTILGFGVWCRIEGLELRVVGRGFWVER